MPDLTKTPRVRPSYRRDRAAAQIEPTARESPESQRRGKRRPDHSRRSAACRYPGPPQRLDRKSTRLNSSHLVISYAVFCLKKKKTNTPSSHLSQTKVRRHVRLSLVLALQIIRSTPVPAPYQGLPAHPTARRRPRRHTPPPR